jgi:hypothetical protein
MSISAMRGDVPNAARTSSLLAARVSSTVMKVADGLGYLHRHGHDAEPRIDGLRIQALVAQDVPLGHERVHDTAFVALPGVVIATLIFFSPDPSASLPWQGSTPVAASMNRNAPKPWSFGSPQIRGVTSR